MIRNKKKFFITSLISFILSAPVFAMSSTTIDNLTPSQFKQYLISTLSGKAITIINSSDSALSYSNTVQMMGNGWNDMFHTNQNVYNFTFDKNASNGIDITLSITTGTVSSNGVLKTNVVQSPIPPMIEDTILYGIKSQIDGRYYVGFDYDKKIKNPKKGMKISAITPGSPADKAGMKIGEYVTSINGLNTYIDKQTELPNIKFSLIFTGAPLNIVTKDSKGTYHNYSVTPEFVPGLYSKHNK